MIAYVKHLKIIGFLSLFLFTGQVTAQGLNCQDHVCPFHIGAEWAWIPASEPPKFSYPPTGGKSFYQVGSSGLMVSSISFQSSVKTSNHEVLFVLLMSPGDGYEGGRAILLNHNHGLKPSSITKNLSLTEPMLVPANWYIWVWPASVHHPEFQQVHPAPMEVQVTLFGRIP